MGCLCPGGGRAMNERAFTIDSAQKRDRVAGLIGKLPPEQVWSVIVKPYERKRSDDANRRLWALHKLAAEHTGHSVDEMHEAMCWRFLPRKTVEILGQTVEVRGASSKLTVKGFRDFMDQVEAFYIAELGVILGD